MPITANRPPTVSEGIGGVLPLTTQTNYVTQVWTSSHKLWHNSIRQSVIINS